MSLYIHFTLYMSYYIQVHLIGRLHVAGPISHHGQCAIPNPLVPTRFEIHLGHPSMDVMAITNRLRPDFVKNLLILTGKE